MVKKESCSSFINSLPFTFDVCKGCGKTGKACNGCTKENRSQSKKIPRVIKQNLSLEKAREYQKLIQKIAQSINFGPSFPVNPRG